MSRIIKVKLAEAPFWFLSEKIRLTQEDRESDYLDFDLLNETLQKIIVESARVLEVKLFDPEGKRIHDLQELNTHTLSLDSFSLDIEDDDDIPEIQCITISEETEEQEEEILSEEDLENAKILLDNKLMVVKKTIESLSASKKSLMLVQAMLFVEEENRNRKQIISCLESKLQELSKREPNPSGLG